MQIRISERMKFVLLALIALAGLGFVIFAVFFNRSTLQINAEAPFQVQIVGQRSENCANTPCNIVLAPGKYSLQISKSGKKDINQNVELKLGQTTPLNLTFESQPSIQVKSGFDLNQILQSLPTIELNFDNVGLGSSSQLMSSISTFVRSLTALKSVMISDDARFFVYDNGTKIYLKISGNLDNKGLVLPIDSGTSLAFSPDSSALYFLKKDPQNQIQALYKLTLAGENGADLSASPEISQVQFQLSEPLIYFSRTIKNYQLKINRNEKAVALLDLSDPNLKSVYLINLDDFSKTLVMQDSQISGFKFLPIDAEVLAVEKIDQNPVLKDIYLYSGGALNQLPIFTGLNNLSQRQSGELIYPVSKFAATTNINEVQASTGYEIQSFDLSNQQKNTVYTVNNLDYPERSEMSADGQAFLMKIGNNIYQLNL